MVMLVPNLSRVEIFQVISIHNIEEYTCKRLGTNIATHYNHHTTCRWAIHDWPSDHPMPLARDLCCTAIKDTADYNTD
jgi:hypothetical protein